MNGPVLHLDYETYSECELRTAGAYAYAMHPSTDLLCAAWRIGDEPVSLWKPGEPVPFDLIGLGTTPRIIAHNAQFERLIWTHVACRRYGWPAPPPESFWCTAAQAANLGLPRDLEGAAMALGAKVQKDADGRRVMLKLSKPRRATKADARTRWTPEMAPADFDHLYRYCAQDVAAECAIGDLMRPLSERERRIYLLDQKINDRGIKIDRKLIGAALRVVEQEQARLNAEVAEATGGAVTAATQAKRIVAWLHQRDLELSLIEDRTVWVPLPPALIELLPAAGSPAPQSLRAPQRVAPRDPPLRTRALRCRPRDRQLGSAGLMFWQADIARLTMPNRLWKN